MLSSLPKFKGLLFLLVFIFHFFNDYHSEYRFSNRCNHHPFAEIRKCCFIYYAAVVIFKSENISEKKIHTIFYLNSIVLLLNIYVGLLGIGYYAYEIIWGVRDLYTLIMKCLECKLSCLAYLIILFMIDMRQRKCFFC